MQAHNTELLMTPDTTPAHHDKADDSVYAVINTQPQYHTEPLVIAHVGPDPAIATTESRANELRDRIINTLNGHGEHLQVARLDVYYTRD